MNQNNNLDSIEIKKDFIYYLSKHQDNPIQREKGTLFEDAARIFLEKDAVFRQQFSKVLTWADWVEYYYKKTGENPYPLSDKGIDLVAIRHDGNYCAIQCKFINYNKSLKKSDLDSFFQKVGSDKGRKYFRESIIIDTASEWSDNLQEAADEFTNNRRISLETINQSNINWEYYFENNETVKYHQELELRDYQQKAYDAVVNGFNELDDDGNEVTRGKLIMACGTGKTFVSLKITEELIKDKGLVLFLVPSLALINQSVKSWSDNANPNLKTFKKFAVCSDVNAGKRDINDNANDDNLSITTHDLYIPSTTDPVTIAKEVNPLIKDNVVVIFSTYHSLQQIITAQKDHSLPPFDLIICDEAHRTATLGAVRRIKKNQTFFTEVHDDKHIIGKKRLYMTATPKVYLEPAKVQAKEFDADLYSMDDEKIFGRDFYAYSFADAINHGQLTDYRIILAKFEDNEYADVRSFIENNEKIKKYFEAKRAATRKEQKLYLREDDFFKLIAIYKQFCKIGVNRDEYSDINDVAPMQKVMGFTSSIRSSKDIKRLFPQIVDEYNKSIKDGLEVNQLVDLKTKHIDGGTTGKKRERKLNWLDKNSEKVCKLITNVNCLSEGVDVPALDGIVFFQPRQSEINIIQCIGRVLRKAKNKKWGYIMIPIFVPPDKTPQEVLENSSEYKKISRVINALRSIDEDFDSKINSLSLNPEGSWKKSKVIGIGQREPSLQQAQIELQVNSRLKDLIYARTVKSILIKKCVDSNHWEDWVNDVAAKAKENRRNINRLIIYNDEIKTYFNDFQQQLKLSIHPDIKRADVIDMVNQHFITAPIFDALFKNSGALENNVIATSLKEFICLLKNNGINISDDVSFKQFYNAIQRKISNIGDDHNARQSLLHKIYESFFLKAFPQQQERLGIVYTPSEIINFMLHSVDYLLDKEFNIKLEDNGVSIIDPFTGTGSFLVHLINSGLISEEKLPNKYKNELFANEIMLLPYYIASVNIANAYNSACKNNKSFSGICLTDTFEAYEAEINNSIKHSKRPLLSFSSLSLWKNYDRLMRQKKAKIKVIIGNPPYAGASNANQNNSNKTYPNLEAAIINTYAKYTNSKSKVVLYNAYVKAIKWATLRLDSVSQGIIAFITPNGFLTSKTGSGIRKVLSEEFSNIYIFDCKGDQNKDKAGHMDQGGRIFSGVQVGTCITFLVKNRFAEKQGQIYYYTFTDVLKQQQKLAEIKNIYNLKNIINNMQHSEIDDHKAWINQDKTIFFQENYYLPLRQDVKGSKNNHDYQLLHKNYIFNDCSNGALTNRKPWCWNYSKSYLLTNIQSTIDYYNQQRIIFHSQIFNKTARSFLNNDDPQKISWDLKLQRYLANNIPVAFNSDHIINALARPFSKCFLYFDQHLNGTQCQLPKFFANNQKTNGIIIAYENPGKVSALMVNQIMYKECINKGIFFPLSYYVFNKDNALIKNNKIELISDKVASLFQYDNQESVTKLKIFYYIYGVLNSNSYSKIFKLPLLNQLPRIPKVKDYALFIKFYEIGKKLADMHLNFEAYPMWETDAYNPNNDYDDNDFIINKSIKIPKIKLPNGNIKEDLTTIKYNDKFTINNIPLEAYNYKLMNKPVIKLFLDKWQDKTDSKSGIRNNPNDYAIETKQPRYILETLLRVINIALETDKLVNSLPDIDWNDKNVLERLT